MLDFVFPFAKCVEFDETTSYSRKQNYSTSPFSPKALNEKENLEKLTAVFKVMVTFM